MINAVILMPEITKGMKSLGPKGLLPINKKNSILEYQIKILKSIHRRIKICVIIGFEYEKLIPILNKNNIDYIYNDQYKIFNHGYSLKLYFDYINNSNVKKLLVINNGILFNCIETFKKSILDNQSQIFSIKNNKSDFHLGTLSGKYPEYIFYDLPESWTECVYFAESDIDNLKSLFNNNNTINNMYLFEILNKYISEYPESIKKTYVDKKHVLKINSIKDITRAKRFVL